MRKSEPEIVDIDFEIVKSARQRPRQATGKNTSAENYIIWGVTLVFFVLAAIGARTFFSWLG